MKRSQKGKPVPAAKGSQPPATRNTQLRAQTRKLLTKHYRAKHGVR
jgi:hypothetical protein